MAAAQKAWNDKVCQILHNMEAAVNQVAGISFPNASLHTQIPLVRKHEDAADRLFTLLSTSHASILVSRSEYAFFVTEFTALLSGLIPQLTRLGVRLSLPAARSAYTAAAEQDLFWTMWQYLLVASVAFGAVTKSGHDELPSEQQPFHAPLYSAFHSLLTWLLEVSRSPAWVTMKHQHGLNGRNRDLLNILEQPMTCLRHLSLESSQPYLDGHLRILPPTSLGLMCCIITETFGSAPAIVPREHLIANIQPTTYRKGLYITGSCRQSLLHLITDLTLSINNLTASAALAGYPVHLRFLYGPAVIQFLKVLLIWARGPESNAFLVQHSLQALLTLFKHHLVQSWDKDQISALDSNPNIDAAGLPWHLQPLFSTPALETDAMLLHVLSIHIYKHPTLIFHLYQLQHEIVQSWRFSMIKYPTTLEVMTVMGKSIIGLAKDCSAVALQQMTQLAREGIAYQPKEGSWEFIRDQTRRFTPPDLVSAGHESNCQAVLKKVRELMYVTSEVQMDMACSEQSVSTRE